MALIKPRPSPPAHLKKILLIVCLTYFCNVFFLHFLRTMTAYITPFVAESPEKSRNLSLITSFIYIPSIFLGIFVGRITDILTPDYALTIFSVISCSGILLLYIVASLRANLIFLFSAMLVYGTGSNLSKIPMQKITSVLFAGPHLALALNITQMFSHLAGIFSSYVSYSLFENMSYPKIFLVIFLITSINIPLLLILIQLVKLRTSYVKTDKDYQTIPQNKIEELMEVKNPKSGQKIYRQSLRKTSKLRLLRKKRPGIMQSFAKLIWGVDRTFFIVLFMAFFVDGAQVVLKNLESFLFKEIFEYPPETCAKISSITKMFNLITPLSSIIIDKWKFRNWYFIISSIVMFVGHSIFYIASLRIWRLNQVFVVLNGAMIRLFFSLFQSSFYSFFAITLSGNIRGFGFGLVLSVLATAHSVFPIFYSKYKLDSYVIYLGMLGVGVLTSLILFGINIKKKDILNKDKYKDNKNDK